MSYVFIGYSTQNASYAHELVEELRNEGFDVWIDNRKLRSSHPWWDEIVENLRGCGAFIVIMTPQSKDSPWVKREVLLADKWNKRTFPVLLDGNNWEIFVGTQYEDVRGGRLPSGSFFEELAMCIPRQGRYGANVSGAKTDEQDVIEPPVPTEVPENYSTHAVAIFEDGFMLVLVGLDAVQDYGVRTVWMMIQSHDWVIDQEIPIAIVYFTEEGEPMLYGDREIVDMVSQMDFDDIVWGYELVLEWPDWAE